MGRRYYQFGPYRLDPLARTLFRENEAANLTPKVAELLRVLVMQHGKVVSKESLFNEVWPGTFVEEGGLTRNICDLRHALRGFENGGAIQTIPKRGYRFVAPVSEHEELSGPKRKTLAVLPFKILDALGERTIGQRIADALMNRLVKLSSFQVQTLDESRADDPGTNGHLSAEGLLRADFILEGSLQQQDGKLRVSVQLLNASLCHTMWSETFEEDTADVYHLQDALAEEIAGAVGLLLTNEQPKMLSSRYTESNTAYRLYLRGRFHWNQRSEREIQLAISYFRRALAEDPEYAPAFSALSSSYAFLPMLTSLRPHDMMPKAKAAAVSALQIDETLAEARAALALVKWHYEWNWKAAERELHRIIKFQPDHAIARQWYALLLVEMGRLEEAVTHAALSSANDSAPSIRANHASVLHLAGLHHEAIEVARDVLASFPLNPRARLMLGLALQQTGQLEEAIRELETAYRLSNDMPLLCGVLGNAYAVRGRKSDARSMLSKLETLPHDRTDLGSQALIYAGLGNKTKAVALLMKACDEREFQLVLLGVDRRVDSLRSEPAFQTILARLGLN